MTDRCLWVDYAKGIGIILVVYGHVARGLHGAGLTINESTFRTIDSVIYSFHMPLFFFLSGLFFLRSLMRLGSWRLIAGKLDTIAYPYIVWSLIQGAIEVLLSRFTNGDVTVNEVVSFLWHPRGQFWFLYALCLIFVAATIIYRRLNERWHLALVFAAALANIYRDVIPGGIPFNFLYQYSAYFALGVFAAPFIPRFQSITKFLSLGACLVFAAGQFAFHGFLGLDYATPDRLLALGLAAISIVAVVAVSLQMERSGFALLARIGNASLGIYLLHIIAGSGVRILLHKFLGIDSVAVHLILGTTAGIGLPLLAIRTNGNRAGLFTPPQWLSISALAGGRWTQKEQLPSRQ